MPGLLVLLWLPNRCWLTTDTVEIRATWTVRLNVGLDLKKPHLGYGVCHAQGVVFSNEENATNIIHIFLNWG